jgi:hypothetical protein
MRILKNVIGFIPTSFLLLLSVFTPTASAELVLWSADPLTKVMRSDQPDAGAGKALQITAAGGEIVSAQVVVWSTQDSNDLAAHISDLKHDVEDAVIPATAVKLQWVRYIDISRNTTGVPLDELVAQAPASIPDPFWEDPALSVKANQSQPIWIEIHVPFEAKAGDYKGALTISSGVELRKIEVLLHVYDFEVPRQRHLSVINWWSFPGVGFQHIKPYSPEYWDLLEKSCRFLVEHRQTNIHTSLNLIQENGDIAKGYSYDTRQLERYSETAFRAGIEKIHLHAAGSRTGSVTDPNSRIQPNEANLRRLGIWENVIQQRGWQSRFLVSISDEPFIHHEETYAAMVDRVHKTAPSIRCIEAVETEFLGKLDIYVPKLNHLNLWYPQFKKIQEEGAELWFYTCCYPLGRYPNRFLDQPLLKTRVLHWINYLYDLDGFLHWGLNRFAGDDPYSEEGISKNLPLGDRAIAYPGREGFLGSLRFSAMRDGLQDYEYLWVLENELLTIKQAYGNEASWLDPRQRSIELCRRVIQSFHEYTRDPQILLTTRDLIAREIEHLKTKPLLVVQTSPAEGTFVPAGLRHIGIRGLVRPGAKVSINGKPVVNVRPSGYFLEAYFIPDNNPKITIRVEDQGREYTVERCFVLDE